MASQEDGAQAQTAPQPLGTAFLAATAVEKPSFAGRVIRIYLHTMWGLLKQVVLAILALRTTVLLFSVCADPGLCWFLTLFGVLPIYIIAAAESAGWTDEEAAGMAIFGSVLKSIRNSMPPHPWSK